MTLLYALSSINNVVYYEEAGGAKEDAAWGREGETANIQEELEKRTYQQPPQ